MKGKIFALVALMMMTFSVSAQKAVKVRLGLEGGFNMNIWNGQMLPDYSIPVTQESRDNVKKEIEKSGIKPGFHLGALAELEIETKWSIQPELMFSFEGAKIDQYGSKASALYMKIPVVLYYNFWNVGPGKLSPGVGLFFAGGIGGSVKGAEHEVTYTDEEGQVWQAMVNDYENYTKTFGDKEHPQLLDEFDWGLNVKIAYEMQQMLSGMFGALWFSQGFSTSKSLGFGLTVGYKFGYSKVLRSKYNTGIFEYNP